MKYIQYFDQNNSIQIPTCGDRSVIIIDGKYSINRCHKIAIKNNNKNRPNYVAYQIFEGTNLLRSKPVTDIFKL